MAAASEVCLVVISQDMSDPGVRTVDPFRYNHAI